MRLLGGELIRLHAELADHGTLEPQSIALEVLLEDPHLLVVNKPAGLVVHPGSGNPDGTLANALLNHDVDLAVLPRVVLVHMLDKDSSGFLILESITTSHTQSV